MESTLTRQSAQGAAGSDGKKREAGKKEMKQGGRQSYHPQASHSNSFKNSSQSGNKAPHNFKNNQNKSQEVPLPSLDTRVPPPTTGVTRQRSCVANLCGAQGRNQASASYNNSMPAATATCARVKPTMQLYRPPTLRAPDDLSSPSQHDSPSNGSDPKPGLNINAKEFVSLSGGGSFEVSFSGPNGNATQPALKHSKSAGKVSQSLTNGSLQHSKSGGQLAGRGKDSRSNGGAGTSPPLRVHFTDDTIAYDPADKVGMIQRHPAEVSAALSIKRSKSLGSAADLLQSNGGLLASPTGGGDFASANATNAISEMSPLPEEIVKDFHQVLESPSTASARTVMEVMQQLFNKIVQGSKFAEPAARYCIAVIEMEKGGDTFLDTLLNTCQEYFQERDTLLKPPATASSKHIPANHTKWVAYMTFLHEMYTQVKRRQRTVTSSAASGLKLLTLLAECCVKSLEDHVIGGASLTQTECLFFILTGVGRDIEMELPSLMAKVMSAARDGLFAAASKTPAVKKTLLQLIEMNAASWQLPAQAVMYYYPTVGGK